MGQLIFKLIQCVRRTLKLDSTVYTAVLCLHLLFSYQSNTKLMDVSNTQRLNQGNTLIMPIYGFSDLVSNVDGVSRLFNFSVLQMKPRNLRCRSKLDLRKKSISNLEEN